MSNTSASRDDWHAPALLALAYADASAEPLELPYARISPKDQRRRTIRTVVIVIIAGVAGLLPFTCIFLPAVRCAGCRVLSRRAICAANLRGIGQSCHIYANDYDEWFPPDLQTLIDAGHLTPGELQCPSEANPSALVFDYVYVPGLQATVPVDWILAYEDPANHNGEGGNVLYADGHVEFLKAADLSKELERIRREIEASEYADHPWYRDHPLIVP